jgi:hypothetical protein
MSKLKIKEKEFVDKFIENNENATKTVKEVFKIENDDYARLKGHRLITKDNVIEAIEVKRKSLKQALIEQGITEDYLAGKVNVLLNAVDKEGEIDYTAVDKGLKHAENKGYVSKISLLRKSNDKFRNWRR